MIGSGFTAMNLCPIAAGGIQQRTGRNIVKAAELGYGVEMMGTNEYLSGSAELAAQFGCKRISEGNAVKYKLPPGHGDSWIMEIEPAPGLFVANAHFTLLEPITREYQISQAGLWLCSFAGGDVTVMEQGKKTRRLQPGIHVLVIRGQPFKMIFGTGQPIWYTSILVFTDFVEKYLDGRFYDTSFTLAQAADWKSLQYNTPELTMVFEQLKYAVRHAAVPLLYYECKLGEIVALILRNTKHERFWQRYCKKTRHCHKLTCQNEKYIRLVKAELDKNILQPPPIEQLTVIAGMGSTKLRQCFKQCCGITIADYIQQEKMKQAMRLLSHDEMSIQNIARLIGYENPGKFTAAFKKVHGFTPSMFRKSFGL